MPRHIHDLPNDVLLEIMRYYLREFHVPVLKQVCRRWYFLGSQRYLCRREGCECTNVVGHGKIAHHDIYACYRGWVEPWAHQDLVIEQQLEDLGVPEHHYEGRDPLAARPYHREGHFVTSCRFKGNTLLYLIGATAAQDKCRLVVATLRSALARVSGGDVTRISFWCDSATSADATFTVDINIGSAPSAVQQQVDMMTSNIAASSGEDLFTRFALTVMQTSSDFHALKARASVHWQLQHTTNNDHSSFKQWKGEPLDPELSLSDWFELVGWKAFPLSLKHPSIAVRMIGIMTDFISSSPRSFSAFTLHPHSTTFQQIV